MSRPITITANGEAAQTTEGIPIPDYLKANDIAPDAVVVEHNGNALTRAEAAHTRLADGDQLEIVRIVAGG
jgi:thiamine biosynthesis protein ThiS